MKRPVLPYNRPCTFGELASQIEYYLDPDDKEPMLHEDDIVFGIFAGKFEEPQNGIVHFQEIRILRRDAKIPILQSDEQTEEERQKFQAVVESWLPNTRVKPLLEMLKKENPDDLFETGIAHQYFPQYLVECRKVGAINDSAYLRLLCLPERPGSQALTENKVFQPNEDGTYSECTDEAKKKEVLQAFNEMREVKEVKDDDRN